MMDLLRLHAMSLALLVTLGGLVLVSLSASQPSRAREVSLDGRPGAMSIDLGGTYSGVLRPGATGPLDLTFNNPSARDVMVTSVSVTLVSVAAPGATDDRPCTVEDFVVSSGRLPPVRIDAGQSVTLAGSGVPQHTWPFVHMLDTTANQDGCQGAMIGLDYRAQGEVR